jgi:3-dehydroquinate synthetase
MRCEQIRDYIVAISDGLPDPRTITSRVPAQRRALAVTTPTVDRLHGDSFRRWLAWTGMDAVVEVRPLTEQTKTIEEALAISALAQAHGLGRRDVMVAFGGGLCSDVVSVAASLTRRGVAHITVPTTLVGQVDAGIGLKGGVNFGGKKNYLGCFAPPEISLIDPAYLRTLPERELRCGIAEIVKIALVRDAAFFELLRDEGSGLIASSFQQPPELARRVITRAVELMLEELSPNSYEDRTLQRLVDFGHTFSSTLEEGSSYRLRHGEAVAVDMALSCELAVGLGILDAETCETVLETFEVLGLPVSSPFTTRDVAERGLDVTVAHRGGDLNLVVPSALGKGTFVVDRADVTSELLERSIERVRARSHRAAIASAGGDRR